MNVVKRIPNYFGIVIVVDDLDPLTAGTPSVSFSLTALGFFESLGAGDLVGAEDGAERCEEGVVGCRVGGALVVDDFFGFGGGGDEVEGWVHDGYDVEALEDVRVSSCREGCMIYELDRDGLLILKRSPTEELFCGRLAFDCRNYELESNQLVKEMKYKLAVMYISGSIM